MSPPLIGAFVVALLAMIGLPACADQLEKPADTLDNQLDRLESRVIQRQDRPQRTRDLLTDQDQRIFRTAPEYAEDEDPAKRQDPSLGAAI